jgi:integrase
MAEKITRAALKGPPPARDTFLWDAALPGFGIKRTPTGAQVAVYQYRFGGRSRRATIGRLCEALTLDQARGIARRFAGAVAHGRDPLAERDADRAAPTVAALAQAYQASADFAAKAESTRRIEAGRLLRHIVPLLGTLRADTLTPDRVRQLFADIAAGKTAATLRGRGGRYRVRGGTQTAKECVQLLQGLYTWALRERRVAGTNPCRDVRLPPDRQREVSLDAEGFRALARALADLEREDKLLPAAADAIRLLALTGARAGEILDLRWHQVDLDAGRLTIEQHKTRHRTGKARVIALAPAARELLARQPRGNADERVFAPARGARIYLNRPLRAVADRAGLGGLTPHGLRHAFGSALAVQGASLPEVAAALGHTNPSTAWRYIHFANDARAALAERGARLAADAFAEAGGAS